MNILKSDIFSSSGDGGDDFANNDSVLECNGDSSEFHNSFAESPVSPQLPPRPPSAGSQRSPRARRQRTLSQGTSSKTAASTISQVYLFINTLFYVKKVFSNINV